MGVGPSDWEEVTSVGLEKFVLSPFGPKEKFAILQAIEKGADILDCWHKNGLEKARQMAGENKIDLDDQTSQEK
jgi:hypothetical protein